MIEKQTLPLCLVPWTRETCLGALETILRNVLARDSAMLSRELTQKGIDFRGAFQH